MQFLPAHLPDEPTAWHGPGHRCRKTAPARAPASPDVGNAPPTPASRRPGIPAGIARNGCRFPDVQTSARSADPPSLSRAVGRRDHRVRQPETVGLRRSAKARRTPRISRPRGRCPGPDRTGRTMQVTETLNEGLKRGYQITIPAQDLDAKVNEK